MNNNQSLSSIKGVGGKTFELFNKIGLFTVDDILNYYPRTYDKYERITSTKDSLANSRNAVFATVKSNPKLTRFSGKSIISFFIYDEYGTFEVRFFNAPYMLKAFKVGDKKVFRGYLKLFRNTLILEQPKTYDYDEYFKLQDVITPIYALTKDLSNLKISKTVSGALSVASLDKDYLTIEECDEMTMLPMPLAKSSIHFPKDEEDLYKAKRRIIFDEFLCFIHATKSKNIENIKLKNNFKMIETADCKRLCDSLPYELTNAQKKAFNDISSDMSSDNLMNRLVQGDVGSGKTIVAILSLLMCASNGYQGAMMAPTEVLARQHYETVKKLTDRYSLCLKPVLLTGKMSAKDKKEALKEISIGECNLIIGTQALIQDNVEFNNLALVITDEQHRFGVRQREALKNKGLEPHLLVMSATPIPRTLAMIMFAGLSVSIIDELPKNRIPISNCVIDSSFREKAYKKIQSELDKGRQAYIICPMVEDNDEDELLLKSVEAHSKEVKEYFGEKVNVGTLTGKMKPDEKTRIMESFKEGNIDILVATTVIEVGIDVPNASVILIENAERFGLSQLHQLRGRVGRGEYPSFCMLLSDSKNALTKKRLDVLNKSNDGFVIAEEDMKLRGPGELNGIRQSGELQFGLGDIYEDSDILMLAANKYESLKERIPGKQIKTIDFRTI